MSKVNKQCIPLAPVNVYIWNDRDALFVYFRYRPFGIVTLDLYKIVKSHSPKNWFHLF